MLHADACASVGRGEKCAVKRDVADIAAGKLEALHDKVVIDIFHGSLSGKSPVPHLAALLRAGKRKVDDKTHSAFERFVKILNEIRRQYHRAVVFLDFLQKKRGFHIAVLIVCLLDLGAFGKEHVRFVKEENAAAEPRLLKNQVQILFGLADIFAHDVREIDFIYLHAEL